MSRARASLQVPILALRGAVFEWRLIACYVFGLVAVLVPVMLTAGLRFGVINGLMEKLSEDPRNLEIVVVGNYQLTPEWFSKIGESGLIGFLVPTTRSLSATVNLVTLGAERRMASAVQLIPTGPGDPLLGQDEPPAATDEIVLSASVAEDLGVRKGDEIGLLVTRRLNGKNELKQLSMKVVANAPVGLVQQDSAFVVPDLLVATEDFRDGTVQELAAVAGTATAGRDFASARIFARTIDDVAPLAELVGRTGLSVRTRSQDIAAVKLLDRSLGIAFAIIATVGGSGYLLSVVASQWANLERRRRDLSILRLIGITKIGVLMLPVIEAVMIAGFGFGISTLLFFAGSRILNWAFASSLLAEGVVCQLGLVEIAAIGATTIIVAAIAAVIGGFNVVRIEPGESLRTL
jgi:putative ABC transport system permease protein